MTAPMHSRYRSYKVPCSKCRKEKPMYEFIRLTRPNQAPYNINGNKSIPFCITCMYCRIGDRQARNERLRQARVVYDTLMAGGHVDLLGPYHNNFRTQVVSTADATHAEALLELGYEEVANIKTPHRVHFPRAKTPKTPVADRSAPYCEPQTPYSTDSDTEMEDKYRIWWYDHLLGRTPSSNTLPQTPDSPCSTCDLPTFHRHAPREPQKTPDSTDLRCRADLLDRANELGITGTCKYSTDELYRLLQNHHAPSKEVEEFGW